MVTRPSGDAFFAHRPGLASRLAKASSRHAMIAYAAQKKALRRQCLAARDALDPDTRGRHSAAICTAVAAMPETAQARSVALYAPLGSEVDVAPLLAQLAGQGMCVALPRMRPDKRLDFVAVTAMEGLRTRAFGVREPDGPALPLAQLDLILAPGLAFDPEGHRLGYGAGYYDRTLLGYTKTVIGIAFSLQLRAWVPVAPHDRPVDGVVCELGFRPRQTLLNSGQTSGPVAP